MLEAKKSPDLLYFENKAHDLGYRLVAGVDESGRGPLAGPVVASAVILRDTSFDHPIRDSKKLSAKQREAAFEEIFDKAYVGVGVMNERVIDAHNILNASFFAMDNAVSQMLDHLPPEISVKKDVKKELALLIDGNRFKTSLPFPCKTIVKGDSLSLSISCASIVAKVVRDRIVTIYDRIFPHYGFKKHKGYPTKGHREAIKTHGPSMIHRRSFKWLP